MGRRIFSDQEKLLLCKGNETNEDENDEANMGESHVLKSGISHLVDVSGVVSVAIATVLRYFAPRRRCFRSAFAIVICTSEQWILKLLPLVFIDS